MNAPISLSATLRDLIEAMKLFGQNRSNYPLGIGYHQSKWWVTVEVNTPKATFDIETTDNDLTTAVAAALARVRRETTIAA